MSEGKPPAPVEIELKLLFPPDARVLIERHPVLKAAVLPPQAKHLVTTYYDTPDLALSRTGLSLRVRRTGKDRVQTLKSQGAEDGLASGRGEWEWPVKADTPDLRLLAEIPASVMRSFPAGDVKPVWVSDIHWTAWLLRYESATVELVIDEGVVRADGGEVPVREMELELKEGPVGALYGLALEMQYTLPLRLGVETKAARGYRLLTGALPEAVHVQKPAAGKKTTAQDGFRSVVGACLSALAGNLPAAETGEPEGIHQMRVANRRLRAVLRLFADHLEASVAGVFEDELRRIGRELGEARDRDVFCLETLPATFPDGQSEEWRRLLMDAAMEKRTGAHEQLREELEGPALTALVLSLAAWAEGQPFSGAGASVTEPLSDVAPVLLDKMARRVRRRGRHIDRLSMEELHSLRKALKRLRYSADCCTGLYPHRTVKSWLKHCRHLQALLGEINDAVVSQNLVVAMSEERIELAPAAGALSLWSEKRRRKAIGKLSGAWDEFQDATPFWR
ncbi:CYTH and CHAD domain-containing protein [Acetobacter musti]|nr:CYTH and CHAD domain-containing protein [Acetobacter musti]